MRLSLAAAAVLFLAVSGCTCRQTVKTVPPSLGVTPTAVDFGPVKNGSSFQRTLRLDAQTQAAVAVASVTLESGSAPGGAEGFTLGAAPTAIPALGSAELIVTFAPTAFQAYEATLVIASDDPERPSIRVPILGEGAKAVIEVTPECPTSRDCVGVATVTPPAIDFGAEAYERLLPLVVTRLPSVVVTNAGPVPLLVTRVAVEGADAAAFTPEGSAAFPLEFEPAAGFNLPIRFKPTSEAQQRYVARLVIESDDADRPRITVALAGTLRANLPPQVCANLVRVTPPTGGDAPRDYSQRAEWDSLLVPPAAGYDFTVRRDVRPDDVAVFSAISDAADQTKCSADPEDGRVGLTYQWQLVSAPAGATGLGVSGAATPQAQLRPVVTGEYVLSLTVRDAQAHATTVTMKFAVAVKQDLVAQLQWAGSSKVDLDLHLVRPTAASDAGVFNGAFAFFEAGTASKTAGDVNGYAVTIQRANPGAGYDFDWGLPGASDDPKLNVDDIGDGPLLENVSLNYPENDARCATTSCTYKVLVHYFKDARTHAAPAPCTVDGGAGCRDGEACACNTPERCVADGAPVGDAGLGTGKCYAPPKPVVRIFLKGSATPAQVIPLDTLNPPDELALGAPCQLLYVADVEWPAKSAIGSLPDGGTPPPTIAVKGADGSGRITNPLLARFGWRQTGGSLQCSPDDVRGAVGWYSQQP